MTRFTSRDRGCCPAASVVAEALHFHNERNSDKGNIRQWEVQHGRVPVVGLQFALVVLEKTLRVAQP